MELFGNQGSVLGNAALRPEASENWDVGAAWQRTVLGVRGAAEFAHYESNSRDLIVYVKNSASTARAENVARARIRGEEVSLRLASGPLTISGSAGWQTSIDLGDAPSWRGRRLPMRPEHQAVGRVDLVFGPVHLAGDVQMIGENFLNRSNRERAPRRILAGASLSAATWHGVRWIVEGKNLGDHRASDVGGFPLPGRSLFVSCQVPFGTPLSP
jgi:iron complex outermembrane receptor protein